MATAPVTGGRPPNCRSCRSHDCSASPCWSTRSAVLTVGVDMVWLLPCSVGRNGVEPVSRQRGAGVSGAHWASTTGPRAGSPPGRRGWRRRGRAYRGGGLGVARDARPPGLVLGGCGRVRPGSGRPRVRAGGSGRPCPRVRRGSGRADRSGTPNRSRGGTGDASQLLGLRIPAQGISSAAVARIVSRSARVGVRPRARPRVGRVTGAARPGRGPPPRSARSPGRRGGRRARPDRRSSAGAGLPAAALC